MNPQNLLLNLLLPEWLRLPRGLWRGPSGFLRQPHILRGPATTVQSW